MGNDYQALGYSVRAGEEIVVYVGTKGNILPELIFTQFYGESGKFAKTVKLQKGRDVYKRQSLYFRRCRKVAIIIVKVRLSL